jgi:hypothetical protein
MRMRGVLTHRGETEASFASAALLHSRCWRLVRDQLWMARGKTSRRRRLPRLYAMKKKVCVSLGAGASAVTKRTPGERPLGAAGRD